MTATTLLFLAVPGFFLAMTAEAWVARRRGVRVFRRRDTFADLAMGLINRGIEMGWVLVEVAVLASLHALAPWHLPSGWVTWAVAVVSVDFFYYWYHRSHHEIRVLWAIHVVHHSSEEYNLAVALRQVWLVATLLPFMIPVALLGVPVRILGLAYAINLLYQFWIHTMLIDKLPRWYEAVFNTPSHHRVHHGSNVEYLDRNYGGILIVWDRLFGTFEPEVAPVVFGLTKNIGTTSLWTIATHEFVAIWRDLRASTSWRERAGRVLRGPGWSPEAA